MLSDNEILSYIEKGDILIEPFDRKFLRASSVCLTLGSSILLVDESNRLVDVKESLSYPQFNEININEDGSVILPPSRLVLANTREALSLSHKIVGWMSNISSLARLGLQVVLSNLISPGYGTERPSTLTLELINFLNRPIKIYPDMRICHVNFFEVDKVASQGYDRQVGRYSGEIDPLPSRFFEDFL